MSFLMMCKLRIRFEDFYADYGRFLWTVVIIQAISLLIQTTTDILVINNATVNDFYPQCDDVIKIFLAIIYNIVA